MKPRKVGNTLLFPVRGDAPDVSKYPGYKKTKDPYVLEANETKVIEKRDTVVPEKGKAAEGK